MNTYKDNNQEYNHKEVEKKWQCFWKKNKTFFTNLEDFEKPKKYVLSMFPYPSGNGLHVGHARNYTISDALARFYRMLGFNVFFPIGWDAFGLPSEQYAIETNNHPSIFTEKNILNFKRQLKSLGFSYDWSREINTSDPKYYSITQWMFKKIVSSGKAEFKDYPVFWCEKLSTVLSNEEIKVVDGKIFSERENFPVVKRNIRQWIIKITDYSKDLIDGLNSLDWPSSIISLQKNWIGLSEGFKIFFSVWKKNFSLEVFTTRPDTIYGVNCIAISFSSHLCELLVEEDKKETFLDFKKKWNSSFLNYKNNENDGFFTGSYCMNPLNDEKIPVWITNFVDENFGTGCLMISPLPIHLLKSLKIDNFFEKKESKQNFEIDYSFSSKFDLRIREIIDFDAYGNYKYKNSPLIEGTKDKKIAFEKLNDFFKKNKIGQKAFSSHLRDWVFSRQRYWGEPIPVVHLENGNFFLVPDEDLPLELPYLSDFKPSKSFYSPLQKSSEWVSFKENGIEKGKRDVNVMPQWAGSCWYYLAFLISKPNKKSYFDIKSERSRKIIDHWMPVDLYVGGQEHANLHLLYARFWNIFFSDLRLLSKKEPFQKLFCQGMIISSDGKGKMSKSKGNIIKPDECIEKWGADSLRLYEMFISPPSHSAIFEISGIFSMRKWILRVNKIFNKNIFDRNSKAENLTFNKIITEIVDDYQNIKLNVVISKLMTFINNLYLLKDSEKISFFYAKTFLQLLNPLAPHISEEIWSKMNSFQIKNENCISLSKIDLSEISLKNEQRIKIIVKLNDKFKKFIFVSDEENSEKSVCEILKKESFFNERIFAKENLKVFFIKGKVINFVV